MDGMIDGVMLHKLKHIFVQKGDIYHALKCTDEGYYGFGEAYFSEIKAGEIKGWKKHNRMPLNIIVIKGEIGFIIYDDRKGSKTIGQFLEIRLSPSKNYQRLTLAPGLWMAFYGIGTETSLLMDIIPETHDPEEADRKDLCEIKFEFNI